MTGYVRVDTSNNIADGNVISAADLDNEFDGIQAAFNASTGHNHDGTTGEGAPILVLGPTQDVVVGASTVTPKTTNTVDIGSSSLKFKDLFLAGNASIAGTLAVTGATTLSAALTYGGVTLSNAVTGTGNMVLSASPTLTGTLSGANASLSGTLAVTGVATLTAQPILSSLTASRAVFTDGSKGLVSNAITGTGNVVMSASPTLTGTITAEALTTSGTVTLNGGTANGVAYLNGSKVLTTGSALVFDGANLGIGTSSPAFRLDAVNNVAGLTRYSFSNPNAGMTQTDLRVGAGTNSNDLFLGVQSGNAFIDTRGTNLVLVFQRSGTELMRLDSTGLGIGTSSPTNKLSVSGNANITGNTTLGDASTDTVTVNGYMGVGGAPLTGNGLRVRSTALSGTDQQGIASAFTSTNAATSSASGVASLVTIPDSAFTVSDVHSFRAYNATKGASATITNLYGLYIADQTNGTNNYGITSLVSSGTNKWNIYASGTAQNYFAGNVQFAAGSAAAPALTRFGDDNTGMFFPAADTIAFAEGGTEVMRIDSSGRVGINTSSPTCLLYVASTANPTTIPALGAASNHFAVGNTTAYGTMFGSLNTGVGYIQQQRFDGTATAYNLLLQPNGGNVGIGATSASNTLDVAASGGATFRVYDSADVGRGLVISAGSAASGLSTVYTNTSTRALAFGTNSTERLRIDSSGNVGIGTSSPSASAILDAQSTTKGVRMPNMTTTQKNAIASPAAGLMVFDTTLAKLCVYTGAAWQTITSA